MFLIDAHLLGGHTMWVARPQISPMETYSMRGILSGDVIIDISAICIKLNIEWN